MNLKDLSLVELQSAAYEQIAIGEQSQNNLKILNQEIGVRRQQLAEKQAKEPVILPDPKPTEAKPDDKNLEQSS